MSRLWGPIIWALSGMLWLSFTGLFEIHWIKQQPWSEALLVMAGQDSGPSAPPEGALRVWSRSVSRSHPVSGDAWLDSMQALVKEEGLDLPLNRPERIIAIQAPSEVIAPLLEQGRLPESGKAEVLAGDLARGDSFELDGISFRIVGRLKKGVSGFTFAYLLPYSPAWSAMFSNTAGGIPGWLHPEGLSQLEQLAPDSGEQEQEILGGQSRTRVRYAVSALIGLFIVALGGAMGYSRLFASLSDPPTPVFGPLFKETVVRPRLFWGAHAVLYGVFFGCMVMGIFFPLLNYRMTEYMSSVFSEGGLSYIGDAYASENVLQAALATYHNNYVVQTLGFTFMISIFPLALGALKTVASFSLVGFAMSPIWVGTASGYVFHSITMVLELEAYILATFVVIAWPLRLWRGITNDGFAPNLWMGIRIFMGGVIFCGVMLAIAALYEAASLILMRQYL